MERKIVVLIASILKPVNDVRSFEKIGQSMAQSNKYAVNIIGFKSKNSTSYKNISFHPLTPFSRISIGRFMAHFKTMAIAFKVKPQLFIVNTPELLWVSLIIKILFGSKIIYDIQENYQKNILHSGVYPRYIRKLVSWLVGLVEKASKYWVSAYFLAEKIYKNQLTFINNKPNVTLENKAHKTLLNNNLTQVTFSQNQPLKLVYTGTIGHGYGTLSSVKFFKNLLSLNTQHHLTIIGYAANAQYLQLVKHQIAETPNITLITDVGPVPHEEIIAHLNQADLLLLPYESTKNIEGRIPTKMYEALALKKPMICSNNTVLNDFMEHYKAGITIDFETSDIHKALQELYSKQFYSTSIDPTSITWQGEEQKLLEFLDQIS